MAVHLGVGPHVREAAEAVERLGDVDQHPVALAALRSRLGVIASFPYLFAVPNESDRDRLGGVQRVVQVRLLVDAPPDEVEVHVRGLVRLARGSATSSLRRPSRTEAPASAGTRSAARAATTRSFRMLLVYRP